MPPVCGGEGGGSSPRSCRNGRFRKKTIQNGFVFFSVGNTKAVWSAIQTPPERPTPRCFYEQLNVPSFLLPRWPGPGQRNAGGGSHSAGEEADVSLTSLVLLSVSSSERSREAPSIWS